ncbi:hypothetical protein [Streptomyces yerevanensis]|uniref:hypothetical protein n=1 Tax=Streptomyces yerevanensis TaxID=66378 RepID=UPI000526AC37|nr:hypothetical protein [Streptomyces yerevanensis]
MDSTVETAIDAVMESLREVKDQRLRQGVGDGGSAYFGRTSERPAYDTCSASSPASSWSSTTGPTGPRGSAT